MAKVKRLLGIIVILALLIGSSAPFFFSTSPAAAQGGESESFTQELVKQLAEIYQQKQGLTPAQQKIDSGILQVIQTVKERISAGKTPDYQSLSTSLLKIDSAGNVEVKLTVTSQTAEQLQKLKDLGMQIGLTLPKYGIIEGTLPYSQVEAVAGLDFVTNVGAPGYPLHNTGAVTSEGDTVLRAAEARAVFGVDGSGIKVGVMSDGVTHLANSVATGDLPSSPAVGVLKAGSGDEGTAMLEIVHDLAPGSPLAFYGPNTSSDMVAGIAALKAAGCKVIVDDIIFFDQPKFEDGPIAQEAHAFYTSGGVYVTSAGNFAQGHYIHPYVRSAGSPYAGYPYAHVYSGTDIGNTFTVPNGGIIKTFLHWNNQCGHSGDDFDLFLVRSSDGYILAASVDPQDGNDNPWEGLAWQNTTGSSLSVFIAVFEYALVSPPPLILDYHVWNNFGPPGLQYVMPQNSVIGHSAVAEVLSTAAAAAATPNIIEPFSSRGPGTVYFPTPEERQVPNITGVDGVQTKTGQLGFFGNPFYGTSAAAPHLAAIAALVWDAKPTLTPSEVHNAITSTAVDKPPAGYDFAWGFGLADAYEAVASVAPAAPQKLIGVNAGAPSTGAYPGSYFFLYRFQAVDTGDVVIFKIKTSASGNVKVAIYADSAGAPGALLSAVNTSTPVIAGWNNITITSTSVVTGNYYWLAYDSDLAIGYYQSAAGTLRYKTATYSTFSFPNPAGTGFTSLTTSVGLLAGWGFTVPPSAPTVTNSTATNIATTSATLNGVVTDTGHQDPTVHIYWGDNDGGTGSWDNDVNLGVKPVGTFYTNISSLTASTTYYYRCYAVNSAGSDWADATASFPTSAPPTAPTVTNSTGASSIMPTSARLNGEVTSTGNEDPTVHIYWGPSNGGITPGSWAHDVDLGAKAAGVFYTDISSLTPSTLYYYRCYAVNSAGFDWADATASFTTAAAPQKLIGADDSTPSTGAYPGNYFFLYRFQAVDTGNVVIFKLKASGSGNVKTAIYADNAGEPGVLLSAVNTSTPVVAGWNSITIGSTPVVTGTYYWLAYSSDSAIGYYYSAAGTFRYKTTTYSTFSFPNPAGTGFSSNITTSVGLLAGWGYAVTLPPTVTNSTGASNIASTSATLNGEVTNTGGQNSTVHIYWGPTDGGTTPGSWAHNVDLGVKAAGTFYTDISSLTTSTTYYYRCYAVNSAGGNWAASTTSFTTSGPTIPPIVTNSTGASNIMPTSATLNGEVTNTGGQNPTVHIYWGPTDGGTTPGSWAHDVDLGVKAAGTFYTDITGLSADTLYYWRCYAVNSAGGSWAASTAFFTTFPTMVKVIGVDASAPSTGTYPGNYFFLYRFQAVETGYVNIFKIKTSASGNVKVAVYADNAGEPGVLINALNTSTPVTAGWNNISFTGYTPVVAGNYYWLAYSSDAAIGYYYSTGGTLRYKTTTYSSFTFPNPAGTGFSSLSSNGLLAGWGIVVLPPKPLPPTLVSPGAAITFKWNTSSGATKYYLQVNTSPSFDGTNMFNTEVGDVTSQEVTGFTLGITYYWRVKAGNAGGWSNWSSVRSVVASEVP
jgi:hypothetical protein